MTAQVLSPSGDSLSHGLNPVTQPGDRCKGLLGLRISQNYVACSSQMKPALVSPENAADKNQTTAALPSLSTGLSS